MLPHFHSVALDFPRFLTGEFEGYLEEIRQKCAERQVEAEIRRGFRAGRDGGFSYFVAETVEKDSGVGGAQSTERVRSWADSSQCVPQLKDRNERT